jgi:hypothetical protein
MNTATNDNAQSITNINGYALCAQWDDSVERIRDEELAERLGYARPRVIRDLIRRLEREGKLKDLHQCRTVRLRADGRPSKHATTYWLTEVQALKVIAKSETATADAILDEVIAVFVAWRRGELAATTDARLVEALQAIRALQEQLLSMRTGTITREGLSQLRCDVRRVAQLECAARRWSSTRAGTADVYREMSGLTGWGGKGQPWKLLPATLTHTAFTVLRGREASIRRELRVMADDRQLQLNLAQPPVPPKADKH